MPTEVGMERTGGVRDVNNRYEGVPGTPGLRMPIAFSSLARDRGFSTSSQQTPAAYHNHHLYFPTPRPSNSAPNLANAETNSRSHHGYGPDSYYAQRRQNHYNVSQPQSTHQSPHNSILQEEVRRSALIVDRDSTISSSAASSNAMTVDEAIGMYGSDTDNDDYGDTARVEEEVSKFHSFNSVDTQQPLSPIYDNTNNLSNQHPSQLPPPSSRGAPSPPPTGPLPLTPVEVKPIPPPVGVSEVLVDDVVLSQEEPVVDDILPPPPSSLSDTPPTPPQSPPVVPQNPMEVYGEPYRLPPSISSQVPPKLPYVQGPLISDPVKDARDRYG